MVDLAALAGIAGVFDEIAKQNASLVASAFPSFDFGQIFGLNRIAEQLGKQNAQILASISNSLPRELLPDLSHLVLPEIFLKLQEVFREQARGILDSVDWESLRRRSRVPSNWPENFEEYLPTIQRILNEEGLPLAWVPSEDLFVQLMHAKNPEARMSCLRDHRNEVLEDCARIIDGLNDASMAGQIPLAQKAIAASKDGHWEVAAVSAVVIVHTVVEQLRWTTNPNTVRKNHGFTPAHTLDELIERATRAPFVSFYVEWHPLSGKPRPTGLARHLVSHQVTDEHLNEHNCLIGIMLMASLMQTVYQLGLGQPDVAAA